MKVQTQKVAEWPKSVKLVHVTLSWQFSHKTAAEQYTTLWLFQYLCMYRCTPSTSM